MFDPSEDHRNLLAQTKCPKCGFYHHYIDHTVRYAQNEFTGEEWIAVMCSRCGYTIGRGKCLPPETP